MKNAGLYLCTLLSVGIVTTEAEAFIYGGNSDSQTSLVDLMNQAFKSEPAVSGLALPDLKPIKQYPKLAAVYFLTDKKGLSFGDIPEFNDETPNRCIDAGYTKTSCSGGTPANACPYNSSYFKDCCTSDYKYTECEYPLVKSSESCGGKYKCVCDTTLYPITSCTAPQVPASGSGSSCTAGSETRYSECVCPSGYTETCTGQNMQGKGTGCSKNGETKYTGCECKSGYNLTCSGEGNSPANPTDYCLLNGIKYYNNCSTCAFRCTVAEADKQSSVVYEYEECSGKYCAIGCATGYVDWCVKPSTDCGKLGYQKTPGQCPNGYLKCPYGGNAVFCED